METIIQIAALLMVAVLVVLVDTRKEQKRQLTKYGSLGKTQLVNMGMLGLNLVWFYSLSISSELFNALFIYLCYGFLVIRGVGIPTTDELAHLSFSDRLWLRTFHAWLWPYYVWGRSSNG